MPKQELTQIRIAGWKSLKDVTLELNPITVLIGANGAGKSNLVSFYRLLNRLVAEDQFNAWKRHAGALPSF